VQNFHRDNAIQNRIAGFVHHPKAAPAKLFENFVFA
jgi:hypothetical protein